MTIMILINYIISVIKYWIIDYYLQIKKAFLINIEKIKVLNNKADNVPKYNLRLKLDVYEKLNILVDDLINHI